MDAQQAKFFLEVHNKSHKISKLREAGLLSDKRERNPLDGPRSPRNKFHGFDFSIPSKDPELDRWNDSNNNWGLLAKLSSQKNIYDVIYERERAQKQIQEEMRRLKESNMQKIDNELQKQRDLFEQGKLNKEQQALAVKGKLSQKEESKLRFYQPTEDAVKEAQDHLNSILKAERQVNLQAKRQREAIEQFLKRNVQKDPIDTTNHQTIKRSTRDILIDEEKQLFDNKILTDFPISTIKDLHYGNPEVLKKYRAERAQEFLGSLREKATKIPESRPLNNSSFRPAGVARLFDTSHIQKEKNIETSVPLRKARSTNNIDSGSSLNLAAVGEMSLQNLQQELRATEEDVERQRLKMHLNSKTKSYQLGKRP